MPPKHSPNERKLLIPYICAQRKSQDQDTSLTEDQT